METTPCTVVAFVAPRKSTAEYMAPKRFIRSCCLELQKLNSESGQGVKTMCFSTIKLLKVGFLRFLPFVPENNAKYKADNNSHEESRAIIFCISPI